MAAKQRIMVQVADSLWTQEALYYACILARKGGGEVTIVKLLAGQHGGSLGRPLDHTVVKQQDRNEIKNYEYIVEDYGVAHSSFIFPYFSLVEAIVQAADYLDANMVFA